MVFGGIDAHKRPLDDVVVLDVKANVWFRPLASGDVLGPEGSHARQLLPPAPRDFPGARAFHSACCVSLGYFIVVFGGRGTQQRFNDVWVLDTLKWMWTRVLSGEEPQETEEEEAERRERFEEPGPMYDCLDGTSFSPGAWLKVETAPSPREFHSMCQVSPEALVVYGGWTGSGWAGDAHVLRVFPAPYIPEEVMPLGERPPVILWFGEVGQVGNVAHAVNARPMARSGHALVGMDGRAVLLGGGGGDGVYLNDAWVLKMNSGHTPVLEHKDGDRAQGDWRQLGAGGSPPAPRSGHTMNIVGNGNLFVFGGHGTEGWLTKSNVYFGDSHVLLRGGGRWASLKPIAAHGVGGPSPRAYHTLTHVAGVARGSSRGALLLFGGWDGKVTFGDVWLLEYDTRAFPSATPAATASFIFGRATPPAGAVGKTDRAAGTPSTPGTPAFRAPDQSITPPSAWVSNLGRQLSSYLSPATGTSSSREAGTHAATFTTPQENFSRRPASQSHAQAEEGTTPLASGLREAASRMLATVRDTDGGLRGSFFEGHLRETIQLLAELDAPSMSIAEVGALLEVCRTLCEVRRVFPTADSGAGSVEAMTFRDLAPHLITLEQVPRILVATLELATALHVDVVMA